MDGLQELFKQHYESQQKYIYFLMTAAASAIALCVKRTTNCPLSFSMIILGMAILCWAFSFIFGCYNRRYHLSGLYDNAELLKIQNGVLNLDNKTFDISNDPQVKSLAYQTIKEIINDKSDKANMCANWQFRLLVLGAMLFLFWHITEMAILTKHSQVISVPYDTTVTIANTKK